MYNKWYNDTWWKRLIIAITFPIWMVPFAVGFIFIIMFGDAIINAIEYVNGGPI